MSLLSADVRTSIKHLYLSHPPPASIRDASGGKWKNAAPILIPTPANPARGGPASRYANGRTKDSLTQSSGGNPAASRTVTAYSVGVLSGEPPGKKPKYGDYNGTLPPRSSRKKVSQVSTVNPSRKPGQPDNTDLIYVDDVYEDIGEPVGGSGDLLLIGRSSAGPPGASRSSRCARPIPDGDSTKYLRKTQQQRPLLAPENDFQEESSEVELSSSNKVTQLVRKYKGKTEKNKFQPTDPYLDLQALPRGKLKDAMKAKYPLSAPPATLLSKPIVTNGPPDKTTFLPVKAWYLGRKYFDESYHVVWAKSKMTIWSGEAPGSLAHHTEEVDIDKGVETVWYVDPNEHYPNNVIVLETFEKFKKSKTIGAQFSSYFKQGANRRMGQIMIKFDGKSSGWDDDAYKTFVDGLKSKIEKCESLRGKAGDAKWEAADRVAQLAKLHFTRESGGAPNAIPEAISSCLKPLPSFLPISNRAQGMGEIMNKFDGQTQGTFVDRLGGNCKL
ncbi:hypothetical protein DFH09DRAFT_480479 [Mycena vulgaris]|nr:hypothetical protein DFH09DRAFT_480479 [Mycena vulgaris]